MRALHCTQCKHTNLAISWHWTFFIVKLSFAHFIDANENADRRRYYYFHQWAQQLLPLSMPLPPNHHQQPAIVQQSLHMYFRLSNKTVCTAHSDLVHQHKQIGIFMFRYIFILSCLFCPFYDECACLRRRIFLWNRNKTSTLIRFQFHRTPHFISFHSFVFVFSSVALLAACLFSAQLMPTAVETTATMFQKIAF